LFSATRPYIARLDSEHETQLSALLCGLGKSSRINRFGHAASDARVQRYAKEAVARAAYMAGAFDADRLIGVVEVFATCDGVAEVAFAINAGIATLRMFIPRNNWPMRQLAHKAGARLDFDLDEIRADVSVATAASLDVAA